MAAPITLPRRSKGPKPQFFRDPALDHLMAMVIALTGELAVAIERHDTLERLLEETGLLERRRIESYRADAAAEAERIKTRDELIGRVFHILHEQAELAQTMGKSMRSEKLSYVADDRGAILGAADDPALKPRARKPAKKRATSRRAASKTPARKAAAKAKPKRAATKKPVRKTVAKRKARR